MKKIFVALFMLSFVGVTFAQKIEIQNASNYLRNEQLEKAIEAVDKAVVHEDTKKDYKAWFYKGAICLEINNMYKWANSCEKGMSQKEVEAKMASFGNQFQPIKPVSKKRYKFEDGTKGRRLIYKYGLEYIFSADDKLVMIKEPTEGRLADRDFISEAEEALQNSLKYNTEDDDIKQKALGNMGVIYDNVFNTAVAKYNEKAYLEAAQAFEKSYEILKSLGTIDSSSLNNVNLAYKLAIQEAFDAEKYDNALEILGVAKEKFPKDVDLIVNEANIYLKLEDNAKTVETLEYLMTIDDTNPTIFFAAGASYDALKDYEKATKAYEKAIALKPDYFDPNYNLGAIYVNKAAEVQEVMNALPLDAVDEYNAKKTEMEALLNKALPYLEKADEIQPGDQYTLNSLKEIYSRLKMYDKVKEINERLAQ
ncbi:MAG: hypothetical protein CSA95_01950 [Bacteroidetes bacterium]|nr:MAG: hypothetical protein CSA95_01950 [Bacteroidota bacterium]